MNKSTELSAFQKNFNYLTFYLYLMNTKCKYLQDYDDEGDFETHNYFFNLCRNKFADKIQDDKQLLLNDPHHLCFNKYFENSKYINKKKSLKKVQLTNDEKKFIYETYFEYSKTLSKSKFRKTAHNYLAGGFFGIIISILVYIFLYSILNKYNLIDLSIPGILFLCLLIVSVYFFIDGIIILFEIKNKKNNKTKFNYMYSNDYCYKRIKECES